MIKPLTTVNAVVNGESIALADGDNAPNLGKNALSSLLKGEDIHASEGDIIPFHAVDYATVTHSSTEAEDPVDELCTQGEEPVPDTPIGLWLFNSRLTLPETATTFDCTYYYGNNSAAQNTIYIASNGRITYSGSGSRAVYNVNWLSDSSAGADAYRTIYVSAVGTDSYDAFYEWLKANAERIDSLDGTTWTFNETPDVASINTGSGYTRFTGMSIEGAGLPDNAGIDRFGSQTAIDILSADSQTTKSIYNASASDKWAGLPDRTISIVSAGDSQTPLLAYWLLLNATKVK